MDESDLFSAEYHPGFASDMTYWQVFIRKSRWLAQKVVVYNHDSPYHNRVLWFWAKLSRDEVCKIGEVVERIGYHNFDREYSHQTMCVTDVPWYTLRVRFADRVKEVVAYAMPSLAEYEKQPDMIGFQELWNAIVLRAPYGNVPMEQGLPKPWWRFW